jgi:hypothetical protein
MEYRRQEQKTMRLHVLPPKVLDLVILNFELMLML